MIMDVKGHDKHERKLGAVRETQEGNPTLYWIFIQNWAILR